MVDIYCEGGCGRILAQGDKQIDGMRCETCYKIWEAALVFPPTYEELAAQVAALTAAVQAAGIVVDLP
jgi:hypothetical protein